jgi:predicted RNase H-like nuclease (RuvC/YqgF family)
MLKKQVFVYDGTVNVFTLAKNNDGKLTREQAQRSNDLSITEDEIVKMANVAIGLLEAEGSAIAFAEVFKQVRDDMTKVSKRLKNSDVGQVTQNIERDIIESLKEMIDALKKERKKNEQKKKKQQGKPQEGQQKPPEQDLIDLIAELKMIRSMQVRVNRRTEDYHKYYPGVEQVPDISAIKDKETREQIDMVRQEMKNLTERQDNIERITRDIATGKNKTRD